MIDEVLKFINDFQLKNGEFELNMLDHLRLFIKPLQANLSNSNLIEEIKKSISKRKWMKLKSKYH